MKKIVYTFLFTSALIGPVRAQPRIYLADDMLFFQAQEQKYQDWLDSTGLGATLTLERVRLRRAGTELEAFLTIQSMDLDTAINQWQQLHVDLTTASDFTLEEELFRHFIHKMEIPADQGNIQVYLPDSAGGFNKNFFVEIWSEKGVVKDSLHIPRYRSKKFDIEIRAKPIRRLTKDSRTKISHIESQNVVFNKILQFARSRLIPPAKDGRFPAMEDKQQNGNVLEFSITDLSKVVLSDEKKSLWCDILLAMGLHCNDMRRERLTFTFIYTELPNAGGYELKCDLVGKFGSGPFKPRKGGYIDMEPDFDDYLSSFAYKFREELTLYLENN